MDTATDTQRLSDEYLRLNSCGTEIALNRDIPTHRPSGRIDYHILYIESGVCAIWEGGERKDIPEGNIILFRPGEPQHYCLIAEQNSVSVYIHFTGSGCEALMRWFLEQNTAVFYVGKSASCNILFERMSQEMLFKTELYEELCAAYLHQLLVQFHRRAKNHLEARPSHPEKRIGSVCSKMQREYNLDIPLEHYAAECCLSMSRFAHLFTRQVGQSPGAYRNSLRISQAKELLTLTELSVGEIGTLVGFHDQNYFTRLFTSTVGCTPSVFRNRAGVD